MHTNNLPSFKPMDAVSNEVKGTGKILITINEEAKAFVSWADGSRSWVRFIDLSVAGHGSGVAAVENWLKIDESPFTL